MNKFGSIFFIRFLSLGLLLIACGKDDDGNNDPMNDPVNFVSEVGEGVILSPTATFEEAQQSGAVSITAGNVNYFIGYVQASAVNQDPVLLKYVDGELAWSRADYENTGDDSRGYGIIWDGTQTLYAVFSATGTQPPIDQSFLRWSDEGWHTSYGQGGGPRVAVLMKINVADGEPERATYLMSRLSNGDANSLLVKEMSLLNTGNVKLRADAWFSPLKTNKAPFDCEGSSPFDYTLELSGDLSYAISASAVGCQ